MDYDDAADLLGNKRMPVRQQERSLITSLYYAFLCTAALLALSLAYYNGRRWIRNWKEHNHRKMVRRKYGIPDSSKEPFNVAYAKAMQRRKEEQRKDQERVAFRVPGRPATEERVAPEKQDHTGSLPHQRDSALLNSGSTLSEDRSDSLRYRAHAPLRSPGFRAIRGETAPQASSQFRTANKARPNTVISSMAGTPQRKRALDRDDVHESTKKSRNEPVVVIDVDAHDTSMDITDDVFSDGPPQGVKRGSKRQAGPVEDITNVGSIGKKAGKRARRHLKKTQEELLNGGEEEDELMDLDYISRGKKRDRAEAGSTFGGDDESPTGGRTRKNRRQKRGSAAHADVNVGVQARGTKRNFEIESTLGSDEEEGYILSRSKASRKRGKQMGTDPEDSTDASVSETAIGVDPACAGRKVGEEWQVNGQLYKLGRDGRRLRQVLVKKRRSRFSMPEDSQHPDTQAHLVVLVETWLNDDEFKEAEERGEVFSPNTETGDNGDVEDFSSPLKAGKQLLWSSPQKVATLPRKAFKNSIVTNVGLNVNPFERPPLSGYSKRVSIGGDSFRPSPPNSPALLHSKSYSKWEKQDLEAEAMAKLRKKLEEEKKAASPDLKVSFQTPSPGTNASEKTVSLNVTSSSAPSLPAFGKSDASSTANPAKNMFATPAPNVPAVDMTRPKPLIVSTTPSQPSPLGNPPLSAHSIPVAPPSTGDKASSTFGLKFDGHTTGSATTSSSTPNFFGSNDKPSGASNGFASAPPINTFVPKPATSSNSTTAGLAATGGAFGTSSSSAFPSSSPFAAPTGGVSVPRPAETSPFNGPSLAARTGGFATGSGAPTNAGPGSSVSSPFAFSVPQKVETSGKSTDQAAGSASQAPKFSFGFTGKPAAGPVPTSTSAPVATEQPKSTSVSSPFRFNQTSSAQTVQASTANSNPLVPSFSGAPVAQPSSSATLPQANGTAFGGATGTPAISSGTFQFGSPANANANPFGSNKPASAPSPFGGVSNTTSPFGTTTKAASPSPFGNASPFGATASSGSGAAAPVASPFGGAPKPAGEAPKPLFGFGTTGNAAPQNTTQSQAQLSSEKQDSKPSFSFKFGATSIPTPTPASPSTSMAPAFGQPSQNGTGSTSAFTFGNAGGSGTSAENVFGGGAKPATSAFGVSAGNGASSGNIFGSNTGTSAFGSQANGSK
ncbi:hypothetical protein M0805_007306 [Coniferiporia weirii]|nr:hypothetical protein M0805_007306 [Coniferiporia weirii]